MKRHATNSAYSTLTATSCLLALCNGLDAFQGTYAVTVTLAIQRIGQCQPFLNMCVEEVHGIGTFAPQVNTEGG